MKDTKRWLVEVGWAHENSVDHYLQSSSGWAIPYFVQPTIIWHSSSPTWQRNSIHLYIMRVLFSNSISIKKQDHRRVLAPSSHSISPVLASKTIIVVCQTAFSGSEHAILDSIWHSVWNMATPQDSCLQKNQQNSTHSDHIPLKCLISVVTRPMLWPFDTPRAP